MSSKLGPIEVTCDSPPYFIVQACLRIGMTSPADVRWCRVESQATPPGGWRKLLAISNWSTAPTICHCGRPLPQLEAYTFTLVTGKEISYLLGQCSRCHTIYWNDA
jgi:hypothetical protein